MNIKIAIITGANSVIGREIIKYFLENNWRVHATIRSKRKSKDLITHHNLIYHEMDLEKPRSINKIFAKITKKEGAVDLLVNNAGFVLTGAFESYSEKQIKREMDVNFFGALYTIKAILPLMKKQKQGVIINISSLCGLVSFPLFSMYHASKWALEGFTESIKYELEPLGIKIKLVEPGGVKDDKYSSKIEFGENKHEGYESIFEAVHKNTSWFPGFCSSAHVAKIVFEAAIDGKNSLRYIIGEESRMFLNERFTGFDDESFITKMGKRITKDELIGDKLDITSDEYIQNPYKWYELLREEGAVHYLKQNQHWLITGFADCVEVLGNPQIFSSEGKHLFDPILLNCDPPKHTYNKRILAGEGALFSNNRIDKLKEKNKQICKEQFDRLKEKPAFDFLNEFALPYSSLVILALLGVETSNNNLLLEWSKEAVSTKSIQDRVYAQSNWTTLLPLVESWVEDAYKKEGKEGLPEIIFHINSQNHFKKEQLISLVKILILGGNETTPTLASLGLYHLICNPPLMAEIRSNHELIEPFINEVLRFHSPTQMIARTTKTDVEIGGRIIPANSLVNVGIGAANRDPDFFEKPNEFSIHRPKNRILSFGHGAHYCIGATLARQETMIIFEELFNRYQSITLPESFMPEYRKSSHIRGFEYLPIITT